MRRRGPLLVAPTVLLAVTLLAGGCGGAPEAVEIPPEDIPFGLARSPEPTETPIPLQTLTVYFVRDGRLVRVDREVPGELPPAEAAMRALLEGPSEAERKEGMASELPRSTRLFQVQVFEQIAEVDLSAEFQAPAFPGEILLRVAQVVWTLVALPEVNAVRFAVEGEPVSVLTDRGTPVDRPVTTPDYASVAPPSGGGSLVFIEP